MKDLKSENLRPAKNGLVISEKVWLNNNAEITGQAASADQKGTHEFLDAFKKIIKSRQSFGCKTRRPEQQETSGLVPLMLVP